MQGGGVTMIQEQIVNWLNSMRLGNKLFLSNLIEAPNEHSEINLSDT